jgi:branched-chain amino acid transport system substrate-binding protein
MRNPVRTALLGAMLLALAGGAAAQVKIGVSISLTGPAASLGIPARNTITMLPTEIGGQKVDYIILDDASDTTTAVQNTKKLISENHVDAIIGSSITPNTLAMLDVIASGTTPTISLASSARSTPSVTGCSRRRRPTRRWPRPLPNTRAVMA